MSDMSADKDILDDVLEKIARQWSKHVIAERLERNAKAAGILKPDAKVTDWRIEDGVLYIDTAYRVDPPLEYITINVVPVES